MILWLLLYIQFAMAQDPAIEEYCFSSVGKMKQVSFRLKFILVSVDKTQETNNCLTVSTPPHRRELIQSYIRNLDPDVQIGFSSVDVKREPCHIKVEKVKTKLREGAGGGVSTGLTPSINANQITGEAKDISTIQTIKEFELTVNQDVIKGECRVINPTRYEISVEVKKDAKPLIPGLPAGSIVTVPDAQIPKDQNTSRLQTTVQLNNGERLEIGSVVKKLKDQARKIDLTSGVAIENADDTQQEMVYLSIN